jgi:hypothetical protein
MKEIRTIKMVEQTEVKFIADDGKEFVGENAERDCRDYERQKDEVKVKEAFERLDAVELNMPMLDWFCGESEIWKIRLESKKDYYTMTDYFKVVRYCCDNYTEMPKEFPCTMIVMKGYECISDYCGNLKENLQKMIEQLD